MIQHVILAENPHVPTLPHQRVTRSEHTVIVIPANKKIESISSELFMAHQGHAFNDRLWFAFDDTKMSCWYPGCDFSVIAFISSGNRTIDYAGLDQVCELGIRKFQGGTQSKESVPVGFHFYKQLRIIFKIIELLCFGMPGGYKGNAFTSGIGRELACDDDLVVDQVCRKWF